MNNQANGNNPFSHLSNHLSPQVLCFLRYLPMIIKYLFSIVITLMTYSTMQDPYYVCIGILELISIAMISNLLLQKNKWIGWMINSILLFFYHAQCLSLIFAGSFLSLVMLDNVDSVQALIGRMGTYLGGVLFVILCSLLPIKEIKLPDRSIFQPKDPLPSAEKNTPRHFPSSGVLALCLAGELVLTMGLGNQYSASYAWYDLYRQKQAHQNMQTALDNSENITDKFLKYGIDNCIAKPEQLPENPNVILILTEGLSQHIVDDPRNIMPNVRNYEQKGLFFSNYYNHTFATYRGIIGQLYSGYQLDNYDTNSLVSIEDILKDQGYQTTFINTEPSNTHFTNYLESMNFDEVINNMDLLEGSEDSLTDKKAYELLFDTISAQAKNSEQPFFTAIYTFATHISFDSPDEQYGDGSNRELNKFYNADYQFGEFMKKLENSDLSDNTIVVFSADHATYCDEDYLHTFPDNTRIHGALDTVPFFIYYPGITPQTVDAKGRNSLDLAPTILDYMDISENNYFLGTTLFMDKENNNSYDTIFFVSPDFLSSEYGEIRMLGDSETTIIQKLVEDYFIAKTQEPISHS